MKPVVDNSQYRMQAVDLQPHGNTISVECPSDNPFEDAQDISIVTQANGDASLSGPDPRMKSKRILTKGKQLPTLHAGRAVVRQVAAPAATRLQYNGFIPGLGAFSTMAQRAQAFRARQAAKHQQAVNAATIMGLGTITAGYRPYPVVPKPHGITAVPRAARAHYAKFIPGMGDLGATPVLFATDPNNPAAGGVIAPDSGTPMATAANAFTALANAASAPLTAAQNARLTQAQADLERAQAANTGAQTEHAAFLASLTKKSNLPLLIGGGLAIVAAIYFLSKPTKKRAA